MTLLPGWAAKVFDGRCRTGSGTDRTAAHSIWQLSAGPHPGQARVSHRRCAYRVNQAAYAAHAHETRRPGASYFNVNEDIERLSLEAAQRADADDRWEADEPGAFRRKAKVVFPRDVGVHGRTGLPTTVVNVYRKKTGTIHISPGSPDDRS